MGLINYIEWLPCAGKSLLIKKLEANNEKVVHELWRILKKEEFPWDWRSVEEVNLIDKRFINKESLRYGLIDDKDWNVYFDRSFLTHLSYAYAYSKFTNLPFLKNTIKLYEKALEDWNLIVPDTIVNISVPSTISIQRQKEKIKDNPHKALPYFFREKSFLDNLLYAYSKLYESYTWNFIDIDWRLTTEEKLAKVLNSPDNVWWTLDLDHYLNAIL